MTHSSRFWDRVALRYSKSPVANEAAYQKKLAITREYLKPDMDLLEFGCGTGSTAIVHAPRVKHILALDISGKMLEIAKEKAEANGISNITFEKSDIVDFSAPDQTFDAVLGLSILHLLEDRDAVIARVHDLLKPGGVFVSSTVCIGNRMKFLRFIAPVGKIFGLTLKVLTTDELITSLTRAGFEIDRQWQPNDRAAVFIVAKKAE